VPAIAHQPRQQPHDARIVLAEDGFEARTGDASAGGTGPFGRRQGEFLGGLHTAYYVAHGGFVTGI